jgi:hypothetical protein
MGREKSYKEWLKAVKVDHNELLNVPKDLWTDELCFEAVKTDYSILHYIPEEHLTKEICIYTYQKSPGGGIRYIPKKLKSIYYKHIHDYRKNILIKNYKNINKTILYYNDWKKFVSTQTKNGKIMDPYIPFEGKKFDKFKILIYGTAQNISWDHSVRDSLIKNPKKQIERLYYDFEFEKKYPIQNISYYEIGIGPYEGGILPALIGVFIFAKFGKKIKRINNICDYIAMTNYYKYSLHTDKEDINPENKINKLKVSSKFKEEYLRINDELVKKEINYLNPKFILAFKGRKIKILEKNDEYELFEINDPAWIKKGGSGKFKSGGEWNKIAKKYLNQPINNLIDSYLKYITYNFPKEKMKRIIKMYLLYYYDQWKSKI